jgi:hypothetical protein
MNDIEVLSETIELFFVKYFDNIELAGNVKHQKKENINYISIDLQNIEIGGDFEKIHSTLNKYIREWAKINISYFQDYISIAKLTLEYLFLDEKYGIKEDQPALRKALFKSEVKFCVLPPEVHCIPAIFTRVVGKNVICVHNHSFERARQIGSMINNRKYADCCAYVDGFGVMRNPYTMDFFESIQFFLRVIWLFLFLIPRALYISIKTSVRKNAGAKL